jgi:hypothetical protein
MNAETIMPSITLDFALRMVPPGHWSHVGHNAGPSPLTQELFRASVYAKDHAGPVPYVLDSSAARALGQAAKAARQALPA